MKRDEPLLKFAFEKSLVGNRQTSFMMLDELANQRMEPTRR
jgi:hypothetical protein